MAQLIMHWKNDHTSVSPAEAPSNCKIVNFTELNSAMDKWLDIVQYGLSDGKKGPDYYHNTMTALSFYNEDKCFFILENEKAKAIETYDRMIACIRDEWGYKEEDAAVTEVERKKRKLLR